MNEYHVIGIMSGSSLDGLDVCSAKFTLERNEWIYEILDAATLAIPQKLTGQLRNADKLSALELFKLDTQYGEWIGNAVRDFIGRTRLKPVLIGIHGHTVFHEPVDRVTVQLGSGMVISQITKLPVVEQFRMKDVIKGGQGAPLVPAGEHYLLKEYDAFVNLGGIANLSVHGQQIQAWDVAPCNQILNHFAQKLGHAYDESGNLAESGTYDAGWYEGIAKLNFFQQAPPKALSNQWRENILHLPAPAPRDALHTYSRFLADQLAQELTAHLTRGSRILFTGGGTFNDFLIQRIQRNLDQQLEVVIPPESLIHYKEALVFGFLGLLRILGKPNVLSSVTGATSDSVSGIVHSDDH